MGDPIIGATIRLAVDRRRDRRCRRSVVPLLAVLEEKEKERGGEKEEAGVMTPNRGAHPLIFLFNIKSIDKQKPGPNRLILGWKFHF